MGAVKEYLITKVEEEVNSEEILNNNDLYDKFIEDLEEEQNENKFFQKFDNME